MENRNHFQRHWTALGYRDELSRGSTVEIVLLAIGIAFTLAAFAVPVFI